MKARWENKLLGEVIQLEYGKPLDSSDRKHKGDYPAYGANGIKDRTDKFYRDKPSIIVGRKGSAGEITLTEEKFWPLDVTYFVEFDRDRYNLQFLYYLLITLELPSLAKGVKPGINRNEVYALPVTVPPLLEQHRIVAILDDAFDGIATAKANAEKNLQNARALFESHLQAVFSQRGEEWEEKMLQDVVDSDCSLSYGIVQPGHEYLDGLPVIRPTDLVTKIIEIDGLKRIDPSLANSYRRTKLRGGDLLLCVRGSTGVVSVASPELAGANVTRGIVPINFDPALVSQDFGYFLMKSEVLQSQIREKTYGAALMQINIRDIRLLTLPLPPLKEQEALAKTFELLMNKTQHLESIYKQKLTALDKLKKSLLHQAFSGQF